MVITVVEPVFAGILVSLVNKYILSGQCCSWLQSSCESQGEIVEAGEEHDEEGVSSTTTTVSDASVHVHCH